MAIKLSREIVVNNDDLRRPASLETDIDKEIERYALENAKASTAKEIPLESLNAMLGGQPLITMVTV